MKTKYENTRNDLIKTWKKRFNCSKACLVHQIQFTVHNYPLPGELKAYLCDWKLSKSCQRCDLKFLMFCASSKMKYRHRLRRKAWWSWITSLYEVMQTWNALGFVHPKHNKKKTLAWRFPQSFMKSYPFVSVAGPFVFRSTSGFWRKDTTS